MATTEHPGWRVQLCVHRAVRRDIARLSAALADALSPEPAALRSYWRVTHYQLHEHHVLEDMVIWPLMRARLGGRVNGSLDRNRQEHRNMAAAMDRFNDDLDAMVADGTAARAALAQASEVIELHLVHEEADVLPLIPDAFTYADVTAFSREAAKTNPPSVFLSWMLDDAPAEDLEFFTEPMPPEVRADLESQWLPAWRVTVEGLRPTVRG